MSYAELAELDRSGQLVDELVRAELVPGTKLVHLAVGDRAGIVLTPSVARALGRDLIQASRGRADRDAVRPAAGRRTGRR